ncbi:MAG: hypothetical protein ACRD8O_17555, partial [Bryobacteraceae bacterium]
MSPRSCSPRFIIWLLTPGLLLAQTTTGDRLVVGSMSSAAYATFQQSIPLPSAPNQKFCDSVQLSSGAFYEAYVPTAAERSGNFSAFSGLLTDPNTKEPFGGGIIPSTRIPGVFAWRVASPPGGTGPNCVRFPAGYVPFSTVSYLTAAIPGTRQFAVGPAALIFDYVPSVFFAPTQALSVW